MINITDLWNRKHGHLRPFSRHLPLPAGQLRICGECHGEGAFYLLADIQARNGRWFRSAEVLYCPTCESYRLDLEGISGWDRGEIADIDAKLWSGQPSFLDIEPTTRCNFRCWYCIGRHMPQADLALSDFSRLLAHAEGIKTFALVGEGEPLLHSGLFEMASRVRAAGGKALTISNGSLFTPENVKRLCETGFVYIAVSIDSTHRDLFSRSRIRGNLDDTLQGIRRLRTFRDARGFRYPKIGVKGTLFDYNENEMLDIVKLARGYGAEIFESFQALNPKSSYVAIYPEEQQRQLAAIERVALRIAEQSQEARRLLRPIEDFLDEEQIVFSGQDRVNPLRNHCDERSIYALLSGDITPCCQIKIPLDPDWNIIRNPLHHILKTKSYENMRFNLWNGIFPDFCEGCMKTKGL